MSEANTSKTAANRKTTENVLPINRIRAIMKSSDDVGLVSNEACYLVCFATERFIKYLAESSFDKNSKSKILEYKDLANFVESNDTLDFLHPILPQKITVKKFREIMAKEKIKSLSDSDTTSEDESDEEGEEEEEEGSEESSESETDVKKDLVKGEVIELSSSDSNESTTKLTSKHKTGDDSF